MGFGLQRFDLGAITRRLELPEVSTDPAKPLTLIVRYCGHGNTRWENAVFRRAVAKQDAPPADAPPVLDPVAEQAATHAATNASIAEAQIITEWEQVFENDGPAPCTADAVGRFLAELLECRPDVWRRAINYVLTRENFDPAPQGDATALGKG